MPKKITLPLDGLFPTTRYIGSKRRLLNQLFEVFSDLKFNSALDLFSGTAIVSFLLKKMGKQVIANDYLISNYLSAIALIENDNVVLSTEDVNNIIETASSEPQTSFISSTLPGLYFTDEENAWLDSAHSGIINLGNIYQPNIARFKKALAFHCVFQSALRKRPFNSFHRLNLGLRLAKVTRKFGNLTTWNRSFNDHFEEIAEETRNIIFTNGRNHTIYNNDAIDWDDPPYTDLVYIDPPYVWPEANLPDVDYLARYHFLEGYAKYERWSELIDYDSKKLSISDGYAVWPGSGVRYREQIHNIFNSLFARFRNRIIVLSYREPGVPNIDEISQMMRNYKERVTVLKWPYKYALRKPSDNVSNEVIFIGYS